MLSSDRRALLLAGLQAADLVVTQVSPRYGAEHLDHLGVPGALRPALPVIKAAAIGALLVTSRRSSLRSIVGSALVAYYAAAATFHVLAGDGPTEVAPAAGCALIAATLV